MNTIGDNIKRIRQMKGLTARRLADLAGVSNGYISQLENANKTQKQISPTVEVLQKIANGLDVNIQELTQGTEIEYSKASDIIENEFIREYIERKFESLPLKEQKAFLKKYINLMLD